MTGRPELVILVFRRVRLRPPVARPASEEMAAVH